VWAQKIHDAKATLLVDIVITAAMSVLSIAVQAAVYYKSRKRGDCHDDTLVLTGCTCGFVSCIGIFCGMAGPAGPGSTSWESRSLKNLSPYGWLVLLFGLECLLVLLFRSRLRALLSRPLPVTFRRSRQAVLP
jgi:hypothetical protein